MDAATGEQNSTVSDAEDCHDALGGSEGEAAMSKDMCPPDQEIESIFRMARESADFFGDLAKVLVNIERPNGLLEPGTRAGKRIAQ